MSTSRGSSSRKRPQKYQNRTAFKNDLHDSSQKTKIINSIEVTGVCKRCKDIIEWKIKYKKYKPLTAPRKCANCEQKTIKHAYHMFCGKCAKEKIVCPKCCKPFDTQEESEYLEQQPNLDVQSLLKDLPERRRRTVLRCIKKQQDSQQKIDIGQIGLLISEMNKITCDDDLDGLFSDEDYQENIDEE